MSQRDCSIKSLLVRRTRRRRTAMGTRFLVVSILSLTILLSCCAEGSDGKKLQGQRLGHLFKSKFQGNSGVDTTPFKVNNKNTKTKTKTKKKIQSLNSEEKEKDRIQKLPGQPDGDGGKAEFGQYGGYVSVDKSAGRAMFYYFVEALNSSDDSAPLLLWLNGGPGCSSLGYGAMQELGPFRVHSDGKTLFRNYYSWNNAANVLFVESPAGVGFSYSNRTRDYDESGDRRTAADNYVFLVNWLERFPEYKSRDFYIAGESYAGHYVPQLAHTILYHNHLPNASTIINLRGILIGNAVINDETDLRGMYEYFQSHALISDEVASQIQKYCDFSPNATAQSDKCSAASDVAEDNTYNLDIYNIYAPLCTSFALTSRPNKRKKNVDFDPCSDYYVHAYLNRPDVQQAMHANVTKLGYDWEPCSDVIRKWQDSPSTVIPLLREFMAYGLRVWIFSGDTDGRVPVTSTKNSINLMKLPIKTPWHAWYLYGEVGGYTQVYEGELTFATVRGAGHQVPSYQPRRALSLLMHFLDGSPLPNTSRYT